MGEFFYVLAAEAVYKTVAQAVLAKGILLSRGDFLKARYQMECAIDGVIRVAMESIPHVVTNVLVPKSALIVPRN